MEKAFSILGTMSLEGGFDKRHVMAVLFVPEAHCPRLLPSAQPDLRLLKNIGFKGNNITLEPCSISGGASHAKPTIYYFERAPQPMEVCVAELAPDGSVSRRRCRQQTLKGEPHTIIPRVDSHLARVHIYRNDGLSMADFPIPKQPPFVQMPKKVFAR